MGAMTLALPVRIHSYQESLRIRQRKIMLSGYRVGHRGRDYLYMAAWNALFSLAERLIPDDFYDWQDEELDIFLQEAST